MATSAKSRKKVQRSRSRKFRQAVLGKPGGVIQPLPLLQVIADHGATLQCVVDAGARGLRQWLVEADVTRVHQATLDRVCVWAANTLKVPQHTKGARSQIRNLWM